MGNESLRLLQDLERAITEHRILIVGTYRNDERPDLPKDIPASKVLDLRRLEDQDIADLSRSILGKQGEMPEIVEFLGKQTEGNPFFIVEMVRLLAEEAGRLSEVGESPMPAKILPGGVKQIIDQRISRVPQHALPLLELAAIAGREIDFLLLAELSPESNLDTWRLACSESAILEIIGEAWRFAHDKLRERLLSRMNLHESRDASRRVAESIESVFPKVPDEAARLAHLWGQAGDEDRQIHYSITAGDHARFQFAFSDSNGHYSQAFDLLLAQGDLEQAAVIKMKMGQVHENAFEFEDAREVFSAAFQLWQKATRDQQAPYLPAAPRPLRMSWGEPASLDPLLVDEINGLALVDQLFVGLGEMTESFDLMPATAESWEILDSGLRYRFHLPADGRWSDGEALTAHDYVYAFRRLLDPTLKTFDKTLFPEIAGARRYWESDGERSEQLGVRAIGSHTLEVELKEAIGGLLHDLTSVKPIPKHASDRDSERWASGEWLVCNGPFRIESWISGTSMHLVRNPYYSGRYRGNVESVLIDFLITDQDWRDMGVKYENNEIDMAFISGVAREVRDDFRSRYEADFKFFDARAIVFVSCDCSRPPFDDPMVRQAFAMAVDKDRFGVESGWKDFVATGGVIPPSMPGHSPDLGLPFDPVQAAGLFNQSASRDALRATAPLLRGWQSSEKELSFLQGQWSQHLGVEVRTETLEWLQFVDSLETDQPSMHYIGAGGFPAEGMLRSVLGSGGLDEAWGNRSFNQTLEMARKARDPVQRLQLIQEADTILIEEAPIIPLFYLPIICVVKPWLSSLPRGSAGLWSFKDAILEPR